MLVGILDGDLLDADQIPIKDQMPDGFASFMGSATSGSHETWAIVEAQFQLGRRSFVFTMTVDQAKDMRAALDAAIGNAEDLNRSWPGDDVAQSSRLASSAADSL